MEGLADRRAGYNLEGTSTCCLVDRRCDWPFVDAWSVVAVAGGIPAPIVLVAAARLDTPCGNWERTMVADTMTRSLPILMEKLPNAGPNSLHACRLLTTGPP